MADALTYWTSLFADVMADALTYLTSLFADVMADALTYWTSLSADVMTEDNLALNQAAWSLYMSPEKPPSNAVDTNPGSYGYTGNVGVPYIGVDLGGTVSVGRVVVVFGWCRCLRSVE